MTFEQAAEKVKSLKNRPANDMLLQLYGLYKQATVGDNSKGKARKNAKHPPAEALCLSGSIGTGLHLRSFVPLFSLLFSSHFSAVGCAARGSF
jgi:diazepam-binding inhibitor (GABA receptor modulating acyl-CoA-binding protein)